MPSAYYQPGADRASRVEALFRRIAPRYDLINDLQSFGLHRRWKRHLVRLAAVQPGERALDLCCGTGDIAFALARAGARTTGLDFTQAMLDEAARRAAHHAPGAVTFLRGDALALPFADASFDLVTVAYGLRNLADLERGLVEIRRVLVPGGRLLVLDFGKPRARIWRHVYEAYLRFGVPLFGRLLAGDAAAYAYILDSLKAYPGQQGVDALLRRLDFQPTQVLDLCGGIMGINFARRLPSDQSRPGGSSTPLVRHPHAT